jgi:hypothetical protein
MPVDAPGRRMMPDNRYITESVDLLGTSRINVKERS